MTMHAYDYEAVVFDGEVFCCECCPADVESDDVMPIFACSEWDAYPTCANCNAAHQYVGLTTEGWAYEHGEPCEEPEADDSGANLHGK